MMKKFLQQAHNNQTNPEMVEVHHQIYASFQQAMAENNLLLAQNLIGQLTTLAPTHQKYQAEKIRVEGYKKPLQVQQLEIEKLLVQLQEEKLLEYRTGQLLLGAIQYSFQGFNKIEILQQLLQLAIQSTQSQQQKSYLFHILTCQILLALNDKTGFIQYFDKNRLEMKTHFHFKFLLKIRKAYNNPNFPDYEAQKIFGIGLSRTATSSLENALNILGFATVHWWNPITREIISDKDYLLFDAFTDITSSYNFETLYHTFPNSTFIYTTRKVDSWEKSITNHYSKQRDLINPADLIETHAKNRMGGIPGQIEANLYANHSTWADAYRAHDKRVRHFFSNKPSHRFLEINICDGEGWEQLAPFLSKQLPNSPFPNKNKGFNHSPSFD